jgi:hypothetical protein
MIDASDAKGRIDSGRSSDPARARGSPARKMPRMLVGAKPPTALGSALSKGGGEISDLRKAIVRVSCDCFLDRRGYTLRHMGRNISQAGRIRRCDDG